MRTLQKWFTASLLLIVSSIANAGIISTDFLNNDDNLLTLDDSSNIVWLDWSYTAGFTFDQILARTKDSNDVLYGFEYASTSDFSSLASSLGLAVGGLEGYDSNASTLLSYLGMTRSGTYDQTFGITDTKDRSGRSNVLSVSVKDSDAYELKTKYSTNIYPNAAKSYYGHALIKSWDAPSKPTDVPEPTSIVLFSMALLGLTARRLKS